MATITQKIITRKDCEKNPKNLYIFGENVQSQKNKDKFAGGGQAEIRGMINSYGFCTLEAIHKYWSDDNFDANVRQIDSDIENIKYHYTVLGCKNVVFPFYGLGTGRANLHIYAPKTFLYMCIRLISDFGFNNIEALEVPKF